MEALDLAAYAEICREAAVEFMDRCSLTPTPDAIGQLLEAFLPCLAIMCERGYDPNGANWKKNGRRGAIFEVWKRMGRLIYTSWEHDRYNFNDSRDMINFLGFYIRTRGEGEAFGALGKPGE